MQQFFIEKWDAPCSSSSGRQEFGNSEQTSFSADCELAVLELFFWTGCFPWFCIQILRAVFHNFYDTGVLMFHGRSWHKNVDIVL